MAIIPPVAHRIQSGSSRTIALRLAAVGLGVAVLITVLLGVAGFLDGPTLPPFGSAAVESLVGAAAGGVAGFAVTAWPISNEAT